MKFKINESYYIRAYDDNNWIIAQMVKPEYKTGIVQQNRAKMGHDGKPKEKIYGYFATLQEAKEEAAELVAKYVSNFEELEKAIKLIKSVK